MERLWFYDPATFGVEPRSMCLYATPAPGRDSITLHSFLVLVDGVIARQKEEMEDA